MDAQWEEFESIVAELEPPFFYVRGNHDINMPLTRKAWSERRGPKYYHFRYKDVLFIALDTEDAERPTPPNMEEDIATYNRLKKEDPKKAMAFIIEWMKTPEAQEAFGHAAKVEFPEEQRAWFKKVLSENDGRALDLRLPARACLGQPFGQLQGDRSGDPGQGLHLLRGTHALLRLRPDQRPRVHHGGIRRRGLRPRGSRQCGHADVGDHDRPTVPRSLALHSRVSSIARGWIRRCSVHTTGRPRSGTGTGTGEDAAEATPGQSLGIASVPNLRDLGGYRTGDGATVAPGARVSLQPAQRISEDDMQKLAGLGLKNACDLRTAEERKKRPEELPPGVEYVVLDVLADSAAGGAGSAREAHAKPEGGQRHSWWGQG